MSGSLVETGETESDEVLHITISGHQENGGPMYQNITVIYFDTKEKADRFRYSPEGFGFDDPYGDGQDSFDLTVLAGDPSALQAQMTGFYRSLCK